MNPFAAMTWEYEGLVVSKMVNRESLEYCKNFEVRDDDVWVCTYPKSGTHWLMHIIQLLRMDGDYEKLMETKDFHPLEVALPKPDGTIHYAYKYYEELPSPRTIVTHLPFKLLPRQIFERKTKVIYLARNPKDIAVSMYHFIKPYLKSADIELEFYPFIEAFISGKAPLGPWPTHVLPFWNRRNEDNVLFLKYEDFKKDLMKNIRSVADFIGLSTSEVVLQKTLENSTVKHTSTVMKNILKVGDARLSMGTFVRKGIVGDWMNHFTVAQSRAYDDILSNDLKGTGLEMTFE